MQKELKEKEKAAYTVEREYLSEVSVQELLVRIIRAHFAAASRGRRPGHGGQERDQ